MMRLFPQRFVSVFARLILLCLATLITASAAFAQAQSNAADLQGYVRDPQGAIVQNAQVTARNTATNFSRTVNTNEEGYYQILNLPPGEYEVTVGATNYKKAVVPSYKLTVGARADLDLKLEIGQITEVVNVSTEDQPVIETSRTTVSNTIEQQRIENLPINQRDYLGLSTTISTVNRGNDRPIGPAPSSGLNIGGQRGRSTLVQVDGADNTDNSINASRSTVSQEAVQEYQVATNSYAPEFGRAIGGIINVVTKGGTNELRGDIFGFIRHKSIQARNAFAPLIDNDPSKKPPFTRVQYGATIGGPIKHDRTFFFAAFEQRRRQESGFFTSNVAQGLTSSITIGAPFLPFTNVYNNLTPAQVAFIQGELASGNATRIGNAISYATFASAGSQTALNGRSTLISPGGAITAGTQIGSRFFLSGAPVPLTTN
ncbi:MAG TPA: carboxypeptidase regulatory-like domain-containing protein, partial [Pyrinomonadaceae bacterium]|nr:carboxypeptidase regulatory-like domain-containing protein [Pyrinomonadaceae bacterium]